MPEQLPRFGGDVRVSMTASAAVVGGQVVVYTSDRTVAPSGGPSDACAGVAMFDQPLTNPNDANVNVCTNGVWYLTAEAALTAGQKVTSGTNGQVALYVATTNTPDQIIGTVMAGAAAGGQALIHVRF